MPSSFFVLLRYFLRVDNVMVRVNDTRYFHDFSTNYVLREFTNKECGVNQVHLPLPMFGDPNLLSPHLPLRTGIYETITWDCAPKSAEGDGSTSKNPNVAETSVEDGHIGSSENRSKSEDQNETVTVLQDRCIGSSENVAENENDTE